MTTIVQPSVANQLAATLGTQSFKVLGVEGSDLGLLVTWTAKVESRADTLITPQHSQDIVPHRNIGVCLGIPNQIQSVLGSTEEDVDPIIGSEKTNFLLLIASNQRHDNDFCFLAL